MTKSFNHTTTLTHEDINTPQSRNDVISYLDLNPVRDDGIEQNGKPERHRFGDTYKYNVTLEDDSNYNVAITMPKTEMDGSDIPNIETTAWLTQPDGMNRMRSLYLAKQAIPSIVVGVQQNITKCRSLGDSVKAEIEIAKRMGEMHDFDTKNAITNGISRGGMAALTLNGLAKHYDLNVPYTDSIVPCFPGGFDIVRDLPEFIHLEKNEATALLQVFRDMSFRHARHLPKTLDSSLRGMIQQAKEIPALLSGEVGYRVANDIDAESFGHITVFEGDVMSQGGRWSKLVDRSNLNNMVLKTEKGGGHMSCIGDECLEEWKARIDTVAEILHENPDNRYLGGTALRSLAAKRNMAFAKHGDRDDMYAIA